MTTTLWTAALLALAAPAAPTPVTAGGPAAAEGVSLRRCTLDYGRSTLLGASAASVLQDCLVNPGDRVKAGQVLGRLLDREARAEMDLKRVQAESDVEVRLAEAKHSQAMARLKVSDLLRARNAYSADQYNIDRLATVVTALEVESAKNRRRVAQIEFEQARAVVQSREIVAPHDGIVVAVLKRQGEPVTPNNPVFHVVDVDRVWVTGSLDVHDAWRVRQGQPVGVSPVVGGVDLDVERRVFPGQVIFVDRLVDPRTQTCKIVAEVDNREGLLRAGLGARMEVAPHAPEATKPAAPAPRSLGRPTATTAAAGGAGAP